MMDRVTRATGDKHTRRHVLSLGRALIPALACFLTAPTWAATPASTTIAVNVTIQATCLSSVTPLALGAYSGSAVQGTATITITCTNTTPYNIGLSAGAASGARVAARGMTFQAGTLTYVLTSDAAYAVTWGDTIGTDTVAGIGNGKAQTLTVYGHIAAGQYATPGSYIDTVTATVTY
jgi:spore coat protein U-like protein